MTRGITEFAERLHRENITDNCIQVMLPYENFMFLFGDNGIMYYKNIFNNKFAINAYLKDERRFSFPYSTIPEHIERVSLFHKLSFVNQIFEYDRPYLRLCDGFILKHMAFKEVNNAIFYTRIYYDDLLKKCMTKVITRWELDSYLRTGMLAEFDEQQYEKIYIVSNDANFVRNELVDEQLIIDYEKQRLKKLVSIDYSGRTKKELKNAISKLEEIESFVICNNLIMVKLNINGDIIIERFTIKYLERGIYEIVISGLPMTKENLNIIKTNVMLSEIKEAKVPKISLSLNPNITKEQLKQEEAKILVRRK